MAYDEEKYITGYNEGYYLAKYVPELSDKLSQIDGKSARLEGLLDGIEQYTLERTARAFDRLNKDTQQQEQDQSQEKDIEPEH